MGQSDTPELLTTPEIQRRYWATMAREYGVWMLWVLLGGRGSADHIACVEPRPDR